MLKGSHPLAILLCFHCLLQRQAANRTFQMNIREEMAFDNTGFSFSFLSAAAVDSRRRSVLFIDVLRSFRTLDAFFRLHAHHILHKGWISIV
jgi:hypothetical protein